MLLKTYIVKHSYFSVRAASRSGGIFTALTDNILQKGGIIYGCELTNDFKVIHSRASTENERNKFRCSKYVQSDINVTFKQVRADLNNGLYVLYSGTSCQIAGLRLYLMTTKTDTANLICVDIICHGVPSPGVWKDYLNYTQKRYNGNIQKFDFINKAKFGWSAHTETIWVNGKEYDSKIWTTLFGSHYILRPACFNCPYKSTEHPSDITIGDAWGIKKAAPEFDDNKGVSLVLVNSEKGNKILKNVLDQCIYREVSLYDFMQRPLISSYDEPKGRSKFWKKYRAHSFDWIVKEYIEISFAKKILRKFMRKLKLWREFGE